MLTILETLVGFYLLTFAWRFWKDTALDMVRDRLFDLRDEWGNHYISRGLDFHDGAYGKMREMLNKQLAYTRTMRFVGFMYFVTHVDKQIVDGFDAERERFFVACDAQTRRLVESIRRRASEAILIYMLATSLGFFSAVAVMALCFIPRKITGALKSGARRVLTIQESVIECAAAA